MTAKTRAIATDLRKPPVEVAENTRQAIDFLRTVRFQGDS